MKSEGSIGWERQWGSKVERAICLAVHLRDSQPSVFISFLQPFTGWEVRVSSCGLNKGTLVEQSGQEVLWGQPLWMITINTAVRSKAKKPFQLGITVGSSRQQLWDHIVWNCWQGWSQLWLEDLDVGSWLIVGCLEGWVCHSLSSVTLDTDAETGLCALVDWESRLPLWKKEEHGIGKRTITLQCVRIKAWAEPTGRDGCIGPGGGIQKVPHSIDSMEWILWCLLEGQDSLGNL